MLENENVTPESLPEDVTPSPSEAPTQETETTTPEQVETQEETPQQTEEQRVPYDRFKEKVDEANWYKQQLEQQNARQPAPQAAPTDPYANLTEGERNFYQGIDRRTQKQIAEAVQQERTRLAPLLGSIQSENFMLKYPEVKTGSPEENQIAGFISQGYPAEHAYKLTFWDKKIGEQQRVSNQTQQQRLEAKRKASPASPTSISPQARGTPKMNFKEGLSQAMNDWNGEL